MAPSKPLRERCRDMGKIMTFQTCSGRRRRHFFRRFDHGGANAKNALSTAIEQAENWQHVNRDYMHAKLGSFTLFTGGDDASMP